MALSYHSVEKAYEVMNELGLREILSYPPDWDEIGEHEQTNPVEDRTYGWAKKSDGGWENLFFFKKKPSPEFIEKWNTLKTTVRNSSFEREHEENSDYVCFGWY